VVDETDQPLRVGGELVVEVRQRLLRRHGGGEVRRRARRLMGVIPLGVLLLPRVARLVPRDPRRLVAALRIAMLEHRRDDEYRRYARDRRDRNPRDPPAAARAHAASARARRRRAPRSVRATASEATRKSTTASNPVA